MPHLRRQTRLGAPALATLVTLEIAQELARERIVSLLDELLLALGKRPLH